MTIFTITGDKARQAASKACLYAEEGHVVKIGPQTKKREQEEKYHAMIRDISMRIDFFGIKRDEETVKRLLIDAFVRVMREEAKFEGKPDPFPEHGSVVPSIDGMGVVQLGVQSRGFNIEQASKFIEHLYAFAASKGIEL